MYDRAVPGFSRRDFIGGFTALSASLTGMMAFATPGVKPRKHPSMRRVRFQAMDRVRVGIIGVGGRGTGVLSDFLNTGHVDLIAACDINPAATARATRLAKSKGQKEPALYGKNEKDFENLCRREDLDLVIIATPWDWHVPMAVSAMKNGHHAAVEVPAANTLAECWKLVETSEETRRHCMILENCCYGYTEMMVKLMCDADEFGEIVHGEAAYIHDLRAILLEDASEGLWRRFPHIKENGNLYPTHGLGPVAQYMNVNRGDRFETLVSLSSREASLTDYRDRTQPADSAKRKEKYQCGDMNTSIIRTAKGRTVMLQHDVVTPRPYTRHNMISGTKGTFADYPARIYLDRMGDDSWHDLKEFTDKYEHPYWKANGELARKSGGHGGMDFIMAYRLIETMRQGDVPDIDVYDTAAWSAPKALSEASVKRGGAPQAFPDFTRGDWDVKPK